MATVAAGVALIPSRQAIEALCRLNSEINGKSRSGFMLRRRGRLLPHLSLFQGVFPKGSMGKISAAACAAAAGKGGFRAAEAKGISVWAGRIFFLEVKKSPGLARLHRQMLARLAPLRVPGAGTADPQKFRSISKKERHSLRKYAYPFAGAAFRPHFTLGRARGRALGAKKLARGLEELCAPIRLIKFERLAVFEVGRYGRFERQIASYKIRERGAGRFKAWKAATSQAGA
ncbi:MAG: DUF1045 domain-containing protein [Candidatus Micrarchaeia archaeon]|jgi:2'-5' RNA ligase